MRVHTEFYILSPCITPTNHKPCYEMIKQPINYRLLIGLVLFSSSSAYSRDARCTTTVTVLVVKHDEECEGLWLATSSHKISPHNICHLVLDSQHRSLQ